MKWLLILIAILAIACSTTQNIPDPYYKSAFDTSQVEQFKNHYVSCETKGKIQFGKSADIVDETKIYPGIYLGNGYVLVLTHCWKFPKARQQQTPFGVVPIPVTVKSYQFTADGKPMRFIGSKGDVSVFEVEHIDKSPIVFGNSDKLKHGTSLIGIGDAYNDGLSIKMGIVSMLTTPVNFKKYGKQQLDSKRSFTVSMPVNYGDSGGLVLALNHKRFEIVGIMCGKMRNASSIGTVLKSNYVKQTIADIIKSEARHG